MIQLIKLRAGDGGKVLRINGLKLLMDLDSISAIHCMKYKGKNLRTLSRKIYSRYHGENNPNVKVKMNENKCSL